MCEKTDIAMENWSREVSYLCKQCSEGSPHELHDHHQDAKEIDTTIAFASTSEELLSSIIDEWSTNYKIEIKDYNYF